MNATNDRDGGADQVQRMLADSLDTDDVRIVADATENLPDGRTVRRISALSGAEPNRGATVVVDADGERLDLAELEAAIGRRLFLPPTVGPIAAPDRAPVTIDPPFNDLVLPDCAHLEERITVTIPVSGATPKADVYLLSDTTGSMGSVIDAVKVGVGAIVGNPALIGFDVAYGVGNYRDFPADGIVNSYAFQHQLAPTTDTGQVTAAISTWNADQGGDTPEGQLFALQQISTDPAIGWRPDARRILVWFGDAPGHDPVCAAISAAAADITEATATAALQTADITVVAISTTTGPAAALDDDPAVGSFNYAVCTVGGTPGQATRITGATGGSHTTGIDAASIVTTLAALIAAAVSSTGNVTLVPSGAITPFVTSVAPIGGYGPLAGDIEHQLPFDVVWDGALDCAEDERVLTGTLDVVADGVVVAAKKVRITVPPCRYHHVIEMLCGIQKPTRAGECTTVVPGRYATAVTIYNPGPCPVIIEKRFAPVLLNDDPQGREPRTVPVRPFAKIELQPGEATMDDCCALGEAVRLNHGAATLGVLDLVADHPLVVTGIYTSTGLKEPGAVMSGVHTRSVEPRRS
jgi:Integrin beta chain VWA domain